MTGKTIAISCFLALLAGCGDGNDVSRRDAAPVESAAEKEADAARDALVATRKALIDEIDGMAPGSARRAELEAEAKRLSNEIRNANNERLRRDQKEVRRQISEQRRGRT